MATVRVVRIYQSRNPLAVVVNIIFAIMYLFIAARILLRLLGASAEAPIVSFIYQVSGALLAPFAGIFPVINLGSGFILDLPALVALVIYVVINWLLVELILFLFGGTDE
jgi:uncharacterized protein YggT (Ycf19 family)